MTMTAGVISKRCRVECARREVAVPAWCLMSNHIHLVAIPGRSDSLAKALGQTHQLHAQRFNQHYGRSGHLWQNRFYSCALGRDYLARAPAYVDLNPVRAAMVPQATDYPWSSARAHTGGGDGDGLLDLGLWKQVCPCDDWEDVIRAEPPGEEALGELREATRAGRPRGEADFVDELERRVGKKLRRGSPGRPPKTGTLAAAAGRK